MATHTSPVDVKLRRLSSAKTERLHALMAKNTNGQLTPVEHAELVALVEETQEITLENAKRLAGQPHAPLPTK